MPFGNTLSLRAWPFPGPCFPPPAPSRGSGRAGAGHRLPSARGTILVRGVPGRRRALWFWQCRRGVGTVPWGGGCSPCPGGWASLWEGAGGHGVTHVPMLVPRSTGTPELCRVAPTPPARLGARSQPRCALAGGAAPPCAAPAPRAMPASALPAPGGASSSGASCHPALPVRAHRSPSRRRLRCPAA